VKAQGSAFGDSVEPDASPVLQFCGELLVSEIWIELVDLDELAEVLLLPFSLLRIPVVVVIRVVR